MPTIHVLGWYNHDNTGDEAYKIAFPRLFPNFDLVFTDSVKDLSPETIILGGGDILYSNFLRHISVHQPEATKYAFSVSVRDDIPSGFKKIISRDVTDLCQWLPDFTFILKPNKTNGIRLINDIFTSKK